jgi:adenylate cyclase
VDAKEIGKVVGIRYVLEAARVASETGAHVWADRFDGERSKLRELQVEFVSRLANSLGVSSARLKPLRTAPERPNNRDAADLVMRGWAVLNSNPDKAVLAAMR